MINRGLTGPSDAAAPTLAELLWRRALESPDSRVYTFLADGEREAATLTFGELHRHALTIAAGLARVVRPGTRALLLYPPGLEYVCAFFGCLLAGVIAVPLYPLDRTRARRTLPRLRSVATDAEPEVALTTRAVIEQGGLGDGILPAPVRVIATDALVDGGGAPAYEARPDDVALLQYTSGSTSAPRGVVLTHANMLANAAIQRRAWRLGRESVGVSWLPLYHDLGVISCLVQPLYAGFHTVMMPPSALLQRPARWLRAISRYRGTFAGGPNFVFDLCVRHTSHEERAALDLSSWSCAFNGAEPIRAETLAAFARTFAPWGFDPGAMYPCYGMAEANFISGGLSPRPPLVSRFRSTTVAPGHSELTPAGEGSAGTALVGCGQIQDGQRVQVIDPETREPCADGRVGEIWVSGPSVGLGYFRREADTEATFQARVAGTNEGPFLRTGDLGAFVEGELYVTGRLKDLIIVRGVNHYPQDIELTAERAHPAVRPGCGAAFSVDVDGEEQLVLVIEIDARGAVLDADGVFSAVRRAVAEAHDLPMHAIVLLAPGTIAKTTSGKIQRGACRAAFLDGTLAPLARWRGAFLSAANSNSNATDLPPAGGAVDGAAPSVAEIRGWLVAQIAARLRIDPHKVDPAEPFVSYGMDSREAVGLSGDLEAWLGRQVSPTVAYAHPSVAALAHHLAGRAANEEDVVRGPAPAVDPAEPIAIVGVGCRFPGAPDPEAYWRLLRDGVDAIRDIPPDRWDARAYYDPDPSAPGKMNTRWGGFLDQIDHFDPLFFGISPREAAHMDPQQRLLLEVAWEAMEDAGMPPSRAAGSPVGVFVGVTTDDYGRLQMRDADCIGTYSATGSLHCIAANRISYAFDFRGPSVAVDTGCSASLVAVHQACQALRAGEVTAALAGGVNVIVSPEHTVSQARLGALAADGRCKTFDARADGIVRGEGAGVVVLKTVSRAVADGDRIYGVLLGSAVNQDGRSNGLTAPNPEAQVALLREAYRRAGVSPGSVSYVEAHGTGTQLGDPIEARALGAVLAEGRTEGDRCAVGSVKTNFGHLEAAAGIAGLIKVALSLHHGAIPPNLHFQSVNPLIPLDELRLRVPTALTGWPAARRPVAGVSSFGIGGTNAHVVLSAAPAREADAARLPGAAGAHLLALSARSPESLSALALAHAADLADPAAQGPRAVADRCYTAGVRRDHLEHRAAFVAATGEELRERLDGFARAGLSPGVSTGRATPGRRVAFVFSGQGAQRSGAGRELLASEPAFREAVERCDRILAPALGWSVVEQIVRPGPEAFSERTDVVQPVLFTLQVALAALLGAWGVEPDAVVGHSMGEVAAAHVAGALTLEEAARVIVERSRELMRVWGQGAMLLVGLSSDDAARAAAAHPGRVHVAVINGPRSTVLSGDEDAVREVQAALESEGVFCSPVKAGSAGHSPLMDPRAAALRTALAAMVPRAPARTFYSTVSSGMRALDAGYWADNLRQPVRFYPAVKALLADGFDLFVELSPHPTLGSSVAQAMEAAGVRGTVLGSLRRDEDESAAMRASLGGLYAAGLGVRFEPVSLGAGRLASLPTYPFQRQRCWLDLDPRARPGGDASARATGMHPLLGRAVPLADSPGAVVWETRVTLATDTFVPEYRLQGSVVFHSFAYLEAALAAARVSMPEGALRVEGVEFREAMVVPEGGGREVQWHAALDGASLAFRAYGRDAGDASAAWVLHAVARVSRDESCGECADLAALRARCGSTVAGEEVYAALEDFGAHLGPRFRGLVRAHVGDGEALGEIVAPEGLADESGTYAFDPALLDACAQTLVMASPERRAFLPVKIGAARVRRRPPHALWSHARVSNPGGGEAGEDGLRGEVRVYDSEGALVAELLDIELRYLDRVQAPTAPPALCGGAAIDRAALAHMAPEARAARVREYLAAAVARVLRLASPVSDEGVALNAMGLDSLMAVELKRRIAADLGADVPLGSFLRHASLARLGDAVLRILDSAEPTRSGALAAAPTSTSRSALDLESEVILDDAVRAESGQRAPQGPPTRPLLTGVTGYLGAFLLADLLRAGAGEVRCLVRAPDEVIGRKRIQRALARRGLWEPSFAGRVVPVTGDLAQPRLGLAPREFDALADAVDSVYHNGALVNFLFPYDEMRAPNVGGTVEILRLATRGALKSVHFVSSLSVFFTPRYAGKIVSERDTPAGAWHRLPNGYAQSKWVAERLISLARERGIPATSYRPVFIGWHSRTGEYNPDDFLCRFILACVRLGAAPEIDMDLMIAPVDYVSAATVALSHRADAAGKNYHLTHAARTTWSDLLGWLGETGCRVARVPYSVWRERLVTAAASESGKSTLRILAPLFPPGEMNESAIELMSARRAPVFDSTATRADLAPSGIACSALDAALVGVFMKKLARDDREESHVARTA